MDLNLNLHRTVLLTLYCQNAWTSGVLRSGADVLDRIARAQEAAREAGMEVMHVGIAFPPGHLVVGPLSNFHELGLKAGQVGILGTPAAEFHPKVAPKPGELGLFSQCSAALVGTPFEQALRSRDVTTIVVTGIATSGSVKNIVTDGTNRFFDIVVLSDCCDTGNAEVDRVLMDKVFPDVCRVANTEDFVRGLASAKSGAAR